MFAWIRTGVGSEGSPRAFIPQHALHLAAFVVLSLADRERALDHDGSGADELHGFLRRIARARGASAAWAVVLLGWQPWAIARVAAFSVLGVVLAQPLLRRL